MITKAEGEKKNRIGLKIVVFLAIFLALFAAMLSLFYRHPDINTFHRVKGFYAEEENRLDAVYVGSSNCYAFWNPLVAWNNYGIAVYPFATSAQPFYATEHVIREARKTQPDALYIVNLNSVEADDLNASAIHYLVNYLPESENKEEMLDYLCDLLEYSEIDRLEFDFPWIRTRDFWLDYLKDGFFPELDGLKGANTHKKYLKTSFDVSDAYRISGERAEIPDALMQNLDQLLDYCDAEGVRILFITVPRPEENAEALGRINTVRDRILMRGYPVLYLTDDAEAIGMDLTQDYYDAKHTNIHGSIKFTNFLSEYLIANYGFADKRGDAAYADWNAAWETYAAGIAPGVLDVELNKNLRSCVLEAPQNLRAEAQPDGHVMIRWDAVDGADSYLLYRKDGYAKPWQRISGLLDGNEYMDVNASGDVKYYYTVVPVHSMNEQNHYGHFSYKGVNIQK